MKICVLEWITGGSLSLDGSECSTNSLLKEGWSMLATVLEQFSAEGHQVISVMDRSVIKRIGFSDWQEKVLTKGASAGSVSVCEVKGPMERDHLLDVWSQIASECEHCLIIAPEIDGILENCIERLRQLPLSVLNCSGTFLANCCDKWMTAQCLGKDNLPHPPTWLACDYDNLPYGSFSYWCCKSRKGAGCEGMVIVEAKELLDHCQQLISPADWIVQPWMPGESFSCSAIVNHAGFPVWLPLATQDIVLERTLPNGRSVAYNGGRILSSKDNLDRPTALLEQALTALGDRKTQGCLGWIGIDLLRDIHGHWWIIEINPRITSSITGLSRALPGNLAAMLLHAPLLTANFSIASQWPEVAFRIE
jgi:predicted ATP-grasp superfamily ATP-dependent carboligase